MAAHSIPESEATIGTWYSCCCEEDLYQVKDQQELDDLLEFNAEWREEYGDGAKWYQFWKTREEAIEDLK